MAKKISNFVTLNEILSKTLNERLEGLKNPDSREMRVAMNRVGDNVVKHAKANVRAKGLVESGALMASIQTRRRAGKLAVGSFGVVYANLHEFGSDGLPGGVIMPKTASALTVPIRASGFERGQARMHDEECVRPRQTLSWTCCSEYAAL